MSFEVEVVDVGEEADVASWMYLKRDGVHFINKRGFIRRTYYSKGIGITYSAVPENFDKYVMSFVKRWYRPFALVSLTNSARTFTI